MKASDLVDIYVKLNKTGIRIWIDGGWGVDALLGVQTRPHQDLDIAIEQKDLARLCEFLEPQGYREIRRDNHWNFVLSDSHGNEIDVHVFIFDEKENVVGGLLYPTYSLAGKGSVQGVPVRCITPEYQVQSHRGYELKEKDFQDVTLLCEIFCLDYPDEYQTIQEQTGKT